MNLIELIQKLISIPSFVDNKTNEKEIGEFIFNYLKQFPYLSAEKQNIGNGRFNIFAKDSAQPKILFACHMDTVEPKSGWKYAQNKIKDNKLYGLGSADMKGGTACVLDVLRDFARTRGLALLFYCDEEYNFEGMKRFAEKYSLRPDLIICPEITDLKVINGCRGIIEIYFRVTGKTGHVASPEKGINAIDGIINIVSLIREDIKKYEHPGLGNAALNLAYLSGGLNKGVNEKGNLVLGNRGNNIPDIAEAVIDIRTPSKELNAGEITRLIKQRSEEQRLKLEKLEIRSDLRAAFSPKEKIIGFEGIDYGNLKEQGYFDVQIISERFDSPFICFGPTGGNVHGADEWVNISSLGKTKNGFKNLIQRSCT